MSTPVLPPHNPQDGWFERLLERINNVDEAVTGALRKLFRRSPRQQSMPAPEESSTKTAAPTPQPVPEPTTVATTEKTETPSETAESEPPVHYDSLFLRLASKPFGWAKTNYKLMAVLLAFVMDFGEGLVLARAMGSPFLIPLIVALMGMYANDHWICDAIAFYKGEKFFGFRRYLIMLPWSLGMIFYAMGLSAGDDVVAIDAMALFETVGLVMMIASATVAWLTLFLCDCYGEEIPKPHR